MLVDEGVCIDEGVHVDEGVCVDEGGGDGVCVDEGGVSDIANIIYNIYRIINTFTIIEQTES